MIVKLYKYAVESVLFPS